MKLIMPHSFREHDRSFNMAMAILEADVNCENYQKYLDNETAMAIGDFITRIGISAISSATTD